MVKSDFWHFRVVSNGQIWYSKKKNKSLAPFWRLNRSDFKLQNIPTRGGCIYEEALFYTVLMIKSDFWHFQAISKGQIGHSKKKVSLQLHFEGLTDLTSNCKTHPLGEVYGQKALFYTVLMVKSDFWHFQALSNGQIWYSKKSKSLALFWRFDRSDFKFAKHSSRGKHICKKKALFKLFWSLKVIFDTSGLFQMVKYGIVKKKKKTSL